MAQCAAFKGRHEASGLRVLLTQTEDTRNIGFSRLLPATFQIFSKVFITAMDHDGCRLEDELNASEKEAYAELIVFIGDAQDLVKSAVMQEKSTGNGAVEAKGERGFKFAGNGIETRIGKAGSIKCKGPLPVLLQEAVCRTVEGIEPSFSDFADDDNSAGIGCIPVTIQVTLHQSFVGQRVVIEEEEDVTDGMMCASVTGSGLSTIFWVEEPCNREGNAAGFCQFACRRVVSIADNHNFEARAGLAGKRIEDLAQDVGALPRGNDDAAGLSGYNAHCFRHHARSPCRVFSRGRAVR